MSRRDFRFDMRIDVRVMMTHVTIHRKERTYYWWKGVMGSTLENFLSYKKFLCLSQCSNEYSPDWIVLYLEHYTTVWNILSFNLKTDIVFIRTKMLRVYWRFQIQINDFDILLVFRRHLHSQIIDLTNRKAENTLRKVTPVFSGEGCAPLSNTIVFCALTKIKYGKVYSCIPKTTPNCEELQGNKTRVISDLTTYSLTVKRGLVLDNISVMNLINRKYRQINPGTLILSVVLLTNTSVYLYLLFTSPH